MFDYIPFGHRLILKLYRLTCDEHYLDYPYAQQIDSLSDVEVFDLFSRTLALRKNLREQFNSY